MDRRGFFGAILTASLSVLPVPKLPAPRAKKLTSATLSRADWLELDEAIIAVARKRLRSWDNIQEYKLARPA